MGRALAKPINTSKKRMDTGWGAGLGPPRAIAFWRCIARRQAGRGSWQRALMGFAGALPILQNRLIVVFIFDLVTKFFRQQQLRAADDHAVARLERRAVEPTIAG